MRLEDFTLEELLELNQLICERIDYLRDQQDFETLMKLRLGQQVHFDGREGPIFGRVIKINRKTVIVESEHNRQWKVSAGLVRPLKDCKPD